MFKAILIISALIFISFFTYPEIQFYLNKSKLNNLNIDCENAKRDYSNLDEIGINESDETRVNLFMNAKHNLTACFDLELLEKKLLSQGVNLKKIEFQKLNSISSDPDLIEYNEK